jgi:diadenosine tetraphosphate (Ap4A) HIT family hydrolase
LALLHPQLEKDTRPVGENSHFWIRYMNDRRFGWIIIVPKQEGVREWFELEAEQQVELLELVNRSAQHLQRLTGAEKINIGALGNMVPQLHIHIIARSSGDPCWPGPVWGNGAPELFADHEQPDWLASFRNSLSFRCA